jgi:hypothetical protein
MRPDLRAELEPLSRELSEAQSARASGGSLASGTRERELAEQMEALHQEMVDATVTFTFQAMKRKQWRALGVAHPPRDDNQIDAVYGVNEDTFFEAAIPASCVSPELDEATWAELLEECSDAEWGALRDAVSLLNRQDVEVPFSRAALQILRDSSDS